MLDVTEPEPGVASTAPDWERNTPLSETVNEVSVSTLLGFPAASVTVTVQSEYVDPSVNVSRVMLA